jgi:transcriptional regulator with GAF, ATPase, and Fis domain
MTDTEPQQPESPGPHVARGWRLRVVFSPDPAVDGKWFPLDEPMSIGREGQGLAGVADRRLTRTHARLEPAAERVLVTDCGSRNGVFVDGMRVERGELRLNQVLRVGDSFLVVDREPLACRDSALDADVIGEASSFLDACERARVGASAGLRVLLLGESGAGKELLARAVHRWASRSGSFVPLNASVLPVELAESTLFGHLRGSFSGADRDHEGVLQSADGGTVFFDEVAEVPQRVQPKLLRERRADIVALFRHYLGADVALTPGFVEGALLYAWPNNVRELRVISRRLRASGAELAQLHQLNDILGEAQALAPPERKTVREKRAAPDATELEAVLRAYAGNVARSAAHFGRDPRQIYRWIERWQIDLGAIR